MKVVHKLMVHYSSKKQLVVFAKSSVWHSFTLVYQKNSRFLCLELFEGRMAQKIRLQLDENWCSTFLSLKTYSIGQTDTNHIHSYQRSWFLMFTVYKVVVTRSNSFKCEFWIKISFPKYKSLILDSEITKIVVFTHLFNL